MKKLSKEQISVIREQAIRERARRKYEHYLELVHHGHYEHFAHTRLICEYLQRIAEGEQLHLMIELPPRHGKSMTVTETFPSYYLGRNPDKRVITSAYNDDLARKFGRLNRNKFSEFAHKIFNENISADNSSNSDWGVQEKRGGMISTGIGGSITGQGADCFVAGTMIDTEIGKVDIKDLHQMKDKPKVLSYNHKKKKQEYKSIIASREVNKKSYRMTIKTQEDNIVTCTPDHPFYIVGDGYVPICKAKMSAHFLTSSNTYDTSVDFDIFPCDNSIFYDIQVEDNHNFYASNLLVHNCLIIDDPIKNAKEALSKTIRENIWSEWESTLSTRLHDGASVIVIMTRWHEDDLIGRLLATSPYNWQRIRLPAVAEDYDDMLGREIGESLCPELGYDLNWANLKKREVGSRTWASLYQQRPAPAEGAIFQRNWIQYFNVQPTRYDNMVMSWDMTFKDSETSDYVVGQVWQKSGSEFYCIDQVRAQMDFTQSVQAVINLKNKYPKCRTILIEDKANGPAIINTLKKKVSGIVPITPRESKTARAYSVTPFFEAGNVFYKNNLPHLNDTVEELAAFPNGSNDDTCFVAGTMIATPYGDRPIETIKVGDDVITPTGIQKVIASAATGYKEVITKDSLTATRNHPIYCEDKGFVNFEDVYKGFEYNKLSLKGMIKWAIKTELYSMATNTNCLAREDITIADTKMRTIKDALNLYTQMYGNITTVKKFQMVMKYITKIAIRITTVLKIWNAYQSQNTEQCQQRMQTQLKGKNTSTKSDHLQKNGTRVKKVANGIKSITKTLLGKLKKKNTNVNSVQNHSHQKEKQGFAHTNVKVNGDTTMNNIPLIQRAKFVRNLSQQQSKGIITNELQKHAANHVNLNYHGGITERRKEVVYNITVENAHCYYANGVLVSNCDAMTQALNYFAERPKANVIGANAW